MVNKPDLKPVFRPFNRPTSAIGEAVSRQSVPVEDRSPTTRPLKAAPQAAVDRRSNRPVRQATVTSLAATLLGIGRTCKI